MIRILPTALGYALAAWLMLALRRRLGPLRASLLAAVAGVAACFAAPALVMLMLEGPDAVRVLLPIGIFLYVPTMLPLLLLLPLLGLILHFASKR